MNEREKMLAGKIYDPFAEGLPEERTRAHVLCKMYNETTEVDSEKRKEILAELMPDRADGVYLQGPIYFDFGKNIKMGRNSYANFNFTALDICEITIGDNVFIGERIAPDAQAPALLAGQKPLFQ
ncbi:MAG: maltose acetyltransferase domain-containing protein [Eubacteriales bacterium]